MKIRPYLTPAAIKQSFSVFYFNIPKIIAISFIWLICCLPVFTIGASFIAMSAIFKKMAVEEIKIRDFFIMFKKKIAAGLLFSLVFVLVVIIFSLRGAESISYVFAMLGAFLLVCMFLFYPFAAIRRTNLAEILKSTLVYAAYRVSDTIVALSTLLIFLLLCISVSEFLLIFCLPITYFVMSRMVYYNNLQVYTQKNTDSKIKE